MRFDHYLLHFRRFCKFASYGKNHSQSSKMEAKIVKAGTLKSAKFTPEANRGPSGTSDDSKVGSRRHSSPPNGHTELFWHHLEVPRSLFWNVYSPQSRSQSHILQSNAHQRIGESSVYARCVIPKSRDCRIPENQKVYPKKQLAFCHCRPVTPRMMWPQST